MPYRKYTDKEKIAYYKRKSANQAAQVARGRKNYTGGGFNNQKKRTRYNYPGMGRAIGSSVGGLVGNAIAPGVGGVVGNALGGVVGQGAHYLTKRITGFGDYTVKANSLVYNVDAVPQFSNSPGCTVITHREFIKDIRGSILFHGEEFRVNPSMQETFPWLSQIASSYEQYVIQGMIFEFKTTCATAVGSTNTALGTVVLATQYNSLAPSFLNKQQMESYEFAQSSVPCNSILHAIECDPQQTQCQGLFSVWDFQDTSGDLRMYDIGKFTIATQGMQIDNATIGELWVSYKICLLKPRLQSIENVGFFAHLDATSITTSSPLGNTSLAVLSAKNSPDFITLSSSAPYLSIYISPSFVGTLCMIYGISVNNYVSAIALPYFSVQTTNLTSVTDNYMPWNSAAARGCANNVGPDTYFAIAYIKCAGGYASTGALPHVNLVSMSIAVGATFDYASLSIMPVPESVVDPLP